MNETAPETALRATETGDDRERLAALEHARWSKWQRWLHDQCRLDDRTHALMIPATLVARWEQQIATPYAELTEREKDSDRYEADVTLAALREAGWVDPEEAARLREALDECQSHNDETCIAAQGYDMLAEGLAEVQAERDALLPVLEVARKAAQALRSVPFAGPLGSALRHDFLVAVDAYEAIAEIDPSTREQP